jgi:hypothetical protein
MPILMNIHKRPREGSFHEEHGSTLKPAIVAVRSCHMGYVDKADRMASNYMAAHQTQKWTKKLFFHLLDLAVLNSYVLLSSCVGKKISRREFLTLPHTERVKRFLYVFLLARTEDDLLRDTNKRTPVIFLVLLFFNTGIKRVCQTKNFLPQLIFYIKDSLH